MSAQTPHKRKWYMKGEKEPHRALFEWVTAIEQKQVSRRDRNRENLSRYLNRKFVGLRPGELNSFDAVYDDLTLNVCNSCVTTVASKLCTQQPRPFILTENGKFEEQERARYMQKFVQGVLAQNDIYDADGPKAFLDCLIFDIGALKVFRRDGKIIIERVLPDEILVDEDEAHTAKPRNLTQRKFICKDVLKSEFPKFASEIDASKTMYNYATNDLTDLVEVCESWHLPSKNGGKDGKKIIAIENCTLDLCDWDRDHFPFSFVRWSDRQIGFYGQGLVEQTAPIQDEIDKIMLRIQESMHLLAVAWVIVDKSSGIQKKHLKNVNAIILEKNGGPDPVVQLNAGVNPQVFEYLDYLYKKAYELSGISQLSAHAQKPEGVRSGAAMRMLLDTESTRWGLPSRQWERMFVDLAHLIIHEAKCAKEDGEPLKVNYTDREWIERIDFSKADMLDDSFSVKVWPTSNLPSTPGGKLALIEELNALGATTDPSVAMDLLNLPDIEKYTSVETAPVKGAHQLCEYLLSGDDHWIPPEEFMNLEMYITLAQKYWAKAHIEKAPQKRIDNLARWIRDAMEILNPPQQPPPPGAMPPAAGAMPADPMAPPAPDAMPPMPIDPNALPVG